MINLEAPAAIDAQLGFNPYYEWLGVRELRRPLTAYQLLGLRQHENDPGLIRNAVEAKREALQRRRGEAAAEEIWEQIHFEVEEAAAALMDPRRRAAYDASMPASTDPRHSSPAVPAAASPPRGDDGESLHCQRCKSVNRGDHKYCAECGEPLWEPCVHCNTICPASERFCGSCGANLAAAVHQQTEQFEMNLMTAEQLQSEARYEEAIALLGPMSNMDHPRLNHHARAAKELVKRLALERQRGLSQAVAAFDQGRALMDKCDYEGAARRWKPCPRRCGAANISGCWPRRSSAGRKSPLWRWKPGRPSGERTFPPRLTRSRGCWN